MVAPQLYASVEVWRVRFPRSGAMRYHPKCRLEGEASLKGKHKLHHLLAPDRCQLGEKDAARRTPFLDNS